MPTLKHFRFWCYKVLPLVYDNSLSYYEVLCKVVDYINKIIDDNKIQGETLESLQSAIDEVNNWIKNFSTSYLEELVSEYLAKMIYLYITDSGYIVYIIPSNWNDITFNTTGLDITNEQLSKNGHIGDYEYGRLVLSMFANEAL